MLKKNRFKAIGSSFLLILMLAGCYSITSISSDSVSLTYDPSFPLNINKLEKVATVGCESLGRRLGSLISRVPMNPALGEGGSILLYTYECIE